MVGIVMKTKFVASSDSKGTFAKFTDYIDREKATNPFADFEYETYVDGYMGKQEKTYGLFTQNKDYLTKENRKGVKNIFNQGQHKESNLWQTVFSFDNAWLEKYGMYDFDTDDLDEAKLREYTRAAVAELQRSEGMENTFWTAAIHRNTDNIHVHIAMVEPNPSRIVDQGRCRMRDNGTVYQRGKIEQKSIDMAKRKLASCILSEREENLQINQIMRQKILNKNNDFDMKQDLRLRMQFLKLANMLPEDLRLLKYNNNAMKEYRPIIDNLSEQFIEKYFREDFEELKELVKVQEENYKEVYGGDNNFAEKKINDLYERLGNSILSEARKYKKEVRYNPHYKDWTAARKAKYQKSVLYSLKRNMKKDIQSMKNQSAYEHLRAMEDYQR